MTAPWIVRAGRIGLRAPSRESYVARWELLNDPFLSVSILYPTTRSTPSSAGLPPVTREQREVTYDYLAQRAGLAFDIHLVGEDGDERFVGEAYLMGIAWPHASAEYGVMIFDQGLRGLGVGTEATILVAAYAFDVLGLNRIWMRYLRRNDAAHGAMERSAAAFGGRMVGVEREAVWAFGGFQDVVVMEILKRDFPPQDATARFRLPVS